MDALPIVYLRGYAGPTAGINSQVDDPFYGFNSGATHIRVDGDGDPRFYQFEGPLLRLVGDEHYRVVVHGGQEAYLRKAPPGTVPPASLWIYRFYDEAATTFAAAPHHGMVGRLMEDVRERVSAPGFDIEDAAAGLYEFILLVRAATGAAKVHVVAHSMGGLLARCMMQKICQEKPADADAPERLPAKEIVAKLFTYGTPHGGISFDVPGLGWAEDAIGPAGSRIFAPHHMRDYLTPDDGGDGAGEQPADEDWNPQVIPDGVFDPDDVFCLVGTDPKDYGVSRMVVGPRSDGLVAIEHAYVKGAHRAYVHRSHSGRYGEVNSEEGYQNLRRFLFGRWRIQVSFAGLPLDLPDDRSGHDAWQADMRLTIRGLPIVMSEQQAAHWCPIQLNEELKRCGDDVDHPVPLVTTFLLDPRRADGGDDPDARPRARYSLTLRVYKLREEEGGFSFRDHLEQVPDWADTLIADVGPDKADGTFRAWAAWRSWIHGPIDDVDPITDALTGGAPMPLRRQGDDLVCHLALPDGAKALPVIGKDASLLIRLRDREVALVGG